MKRVILDPSALKILAELEHAVEVCDESGHVVGHFRPAILDDPAMQPQISEAELDRREAAGGGRSLAEILVDLEKRG